MILQKMYKSIVFVLIATLFLMCHPKISLALDSPEESLEILWYRAYFPPVTVPSGPDENKGFFDRAMNFVIDQLDEYDHNFHTANFRRIILEFKDGKNGCCPSFYKTSEREEFISFSIPAMIVLPNGIITSRKNREALLPYVNDDGEISLTKLLTNPDLTLGISSGRVYSNGLDEVISQHNGDNIHARSGDDVFQGLMSMLYLGRVNYIIGYPTEAGYFAQEQQHYSDYSFFPIAESKVPYTLGYFGCTKSAWGDKIIERIDPILREHRNTDAYLNYYESWLDDTTKDLYRSITREYFTNN